MEEKYDIVIVGCGIAGATAGLAALKEGLKICIIDRKKSDSIGKKICGELMPQKTLEWLKNEFKIHVDYYSLKGLQICTVSEHKNLCSSSESRIRVEEPLCTIDRWQFGQTMVEELVDRGADLYHESVEGPVVAGASVKGVKTKDSRTFRGTVTIDCSGVSSVLRRHIFPDPVNFNTFGIAYKEDLVLKEPIIKKYGTIMFDKSIAPSGYMWCFPKSEYVLNTGVGGVGARQAGFKNILDKIITAHAFAVRERKNTGFGVLPLGRPLPSMVYPGLLVCGDAAFQVNPLTGEGIAPAVTAGYTAAQVAAQAVQNKDTSVKGMWKYNVEFARQYGVIFASLLVLKDFWLSLPGEELAYLMERMIISEDMAQLETSEEPPLRRKVAVVSDNWRKMTLLYRLYAVARKMKKIRTLYKEYPETPEEFPLWNQKVENILAHVL